MNKIAQHTKGPWVVVVEPERPDEPAIMVAGWYVATCHDNANDGDTLANARLVGAAPELLEAATTLIACDFGANGWDDTVDFAAMRLREAVAKATGQET